MIKKAIAVFLVSGSLVLAALIFVGGKSLIKTPAINSAVSRAEPLPNSLPNTTPNITPQAENSTKEIAKDIVREIAKLNIDKSPSLSGGNEINLPQPEKLIESLLSKKNEGFDPAIFNPEIEISDLRVVKGSDKALAENYFKNLRAIIETNFPNLAVGFSQPSTEDFELTALAYQKMAAAVYGLIIPENLIEIHREEIRLLVLHQKIFENLARYQDDPLKALVSVEVLQKTGPQLENLANMKLIFIKNNDLKI